MKLNNNIIKTTGQFQWPSWSKQVQCDIKTKFSNQEQKGYTTTVQLNVNDVHRAKMSDSVRA
jgi:hypothetical protein